jgi:hypothetical protein
VAGRRVSRSMCSGRSTTDATVRSGAPRCGIR